VDVDRREWKEALWEGSGICTDASTITLPARISWTVTSLVGTPAAVAVLFLNELKKPERNVMFNMASMDKSEKAANRTPPPHKRQSANITKSYPY
jgi:hypothetical protein